MKSFKKLRSLQLKKSVIGLLVKLSRGWRPKWRNVDSVYGGSMIVKKFKVENLFIVCTTDIVKDSSYIQVLKIWDILPLEDIPKLRRRLESIFCKYTDNFIDLCDEKSMDGYIILHSCIAEFVLIRFVLEWLPSIIQRILYSFVLFY